MRTRSRSRVALGAGAGALPVVFAAVLTAVLTGCGGSSGSGGSHGQGLTTQPLTGLPLSPGRAEIRRPALFVKIENAPQARPQTGLDKADVVYEAVAEGGITRFAAFFQSADPGDIGPVRSVQPQDPDLAAPLHGVAAFSGGVAPIVADLAGVAQNLSADSAAGAGAYHRESSRAAPHNLYASAGKLWAAAKAPYDQPPSPLFQYGGPPSGAAPASSVDVPLSSVADVRWAWDADGWRRSEGGQPFTVTGSGRIGPANVLIQYVRIVDAGYRDVVGTPVPASVLVGAGRAQLLRDGKVIEGRWSKDSRDAVTQFTTADGQPLTLHPGRTWVELTPQSATVTVRR